MINSVLQFSDLQELCKPGQKPRLSTVEAWLKQIGVPYKYDARGGCLTTEAAFNAAMGINEKAANEDAHYDPNEVF